MAPGYSDLVAEAKARQANGSESGATVRGGASIDGGTGELTPAFSPGQKEFVPSGDRHTEGGGTASRRTRARRKTFSETVADTTRNIDSGGGKAGRPAGQQPTKPRTLTSPTAAKRVAKRDDAPGEKSTYFKASGIEHGVVFGWAIVCQKDGKPYVDVQKDHIPESAMLDAACDFAKDARPGNEMHAGPNSGQFLFMMPLTSDIAKAFGISCDTTGLMVGYKPSPEVLAKFESGEYTGFSIEGTRITDKAVED